MNSTYDLPPNLGDLMGAYDEAHWQTAVLELKPNVGVLYRGQVLSAGAGADAGKLVPTIVGNEDAVFGVLLDPSINTAATEAFSGGTITGSVAQSGSFRGAALKVGVGTDVNLVTAQLRNVGIFVEGPIVAPTAP